MPSRPRLLLLLGVWLLLAAPALAQQKRALTFEDLMRFQTLDDATLSGDGAWVAFAAWPDRGDGEAVVQSADGATRYTIPLGQNPRFSGDDGWVAARLAVPFAEQAAAKGKKGDDAPKPGLALVRLADGATETFERIEGYAFSEESAWLALHHAAAKDTTTKDTTDTAEKPKGKRKTGTPLTLRDLAGGTTAEIADVRDFAFDEAGRFLAYTVAAADSTADGLYVRHLGDGRLTTGDARARGHYTSLAWSETGTLAFLAATEDQDGEPGDAALWLWDGTAARAAVTDAPEGWRLPAKNTLRWTRDGSRLFFGFRPEEADDEADDEAEDAPPADTTAADPYDRTAILADAEVDVWHVDDPLINSNQKKVWKNEQARTYEAVLHVATGRVVPLADETVRGQGAVENARTMLGRAEAPYQKERTWNGFFFDPYVIDLDTGEKTQIADRLQSTVSLSPEGRFVVYYQTPHWYLYEVDGGRTRNLTDALGVPFANEDHDYPSAAPGYGVGGWMADDAGVLIYDKYDIWHLPTGGGAATRLTDGRADAYTYRIVEVDPEQEFYAAGEQVLIDGYHNRRKSDGYFRLRLDPDRPEMETLIEAEKRFYFYAKAEDADVYLFSREDYDEFPDLWVSDTDFANPTKLTDYDAQRDPFAWGEAELVEWTSVDGTPLEGVVIKPGNYEEGKRYPVMVYFYRFMSQRLHIFNDPVVNHRPSFPLYASDGYIVFLPDVRFEIGRPGFSATKAVVPGVQKLVEMGLADPERLGLHGHSWSGYQTAFMVTQTDIFAAAITGAPVSNMTSAYGGIRWGTGLARQFQYEQTQSRLGGSLWDARDRYIDNSPLFFADRIRTPLLIIHGDDDGAVPWYQSIELYLALRRLGKESVFLQYRGEPHHPQKYANKLDWAMKMKEYFDHYLKGTPAPAWISDGVPYSGN